MTARVKAEVKATIQMALTIPEAEALAALASYGMQDVYDALGSNLSRDFLGDGSYAAGLASLIQGARAIEPLLKQLRDAEKVVGRFSV